MKKIKKVGLDILKNSNTELKLIICKKGGSINDELTYL